MKCSLNISDLIYNPFDDNSSDDRWCSDFDPDANFYAGEMCLVDTHVDIFLKINSMKKLIHYVVVMVRIFLNVIFTYISQSESLTHIFTGSNVMEL